MPAKPSDNRPDAPRRQTRSRVLLAIGCVLVPILFALIVVIKPTIEAISSQNPVKDVAFVLERNDSTVIPESLQVVFERTERLKWLFRSEEAFLLAQKSEASFPRVALSVDLYDSLVVLSIQGVPVRTSKVLRFERSRLFERLSTPDELLAELSEPLTLIGSTSTVPRIPMRLVQAPKDTTEARLRPPDAFVQEERNVYAELYFDHNVTLYLTPKMVDQRIEALKLTYRNRAIEAIRTLLRFFRADEAPPPRWIRIEMASDDIRAIYRALPEGGRMAIRW